MELRDIETFLVLAEELHFAKTAERLYLTPSRVTQTIQGLEREVGGPLFERTSRRVNLTALGERFREAAQLGFDQLHTALREAQATARGVEQVLRLGYQYSIGPEIALELAAAFETEHPGSGVVLTTLNEVFDFTAIRNGHVDVLLTWSPGGSAHAAEAEDLTAGPVLGSDQRAVVVAKDHPLATRESITTDDLIGYDVRKPDPLSTPAFADAWTPRQSTSGNPIHQVDGGQRFLSALDLLTTVARSRMAHFTIQSILDRYPHEGVVAVPITDLPPCVIVPVWKTSADNATIRAFADLASRRRPD